MKKFDLLKIGTIVLMMAFAGCATDTTDSQTGPTNKTKTYGVSIGSSANGTVTADVTHDIAAGATVTLTVIPTDGYELDTLSVKNGETDVTVNDKTFSMPAGNVSVSATFKKTAAALNQEAADAVITKINAIGTVAYTDESKAKIDEARTAYNALTDAQKALISAETLTVLTNAESTYNTQKAAADEAAVNQTAADAVITKINAIGTVAYTDESKAKIDEARTAYNALTDAQKALISAETLAVLTNAESTYESLTPVAVIGITLNKASTAIYVGFTETLNVSSVTPEDATDKTVTWSSSDDNVATVDASSGKVTGIAAGNANITATANDGSGITATCAVTVNNPPLIKDYLVNDVQVIVKEIYANWGEQSFATGTYNNGSFSDVTFTPGNPSNGVYAGNATMTMNGNNLVVTMTTNNYGNKVVLTFNINDNTYTENITQGSTPVYKFNGLSYISIGDTNFTSFVTKQ